MITVNFEVSENCPVKISVLGAHCPEGFQALDTPAHPIDGQARQIPYRARGLQPHHVEALAHLLYEIDGQESIACFNNLTNEGYFAYGATGEIRPDWNGLPFSAEFFSA